VSTPPAARKSRPFGWVAVVFVVLLAAGFALGVVVYRRYVAYQPVAGRHVPADAFGSARFDLTHVTLYEPFRRSLFPLVDALPSAVASRDRRARLEQRGVHVAGQVREVMTAFGPAPSDWVVVLGGTLPREGLAALVADVLRAEGLNVASAGPGFTVGGAQGLTLGQAEDGALVVASSPGRLQAALTGSEAPAALGRGAGGIALAGPWLPPSLESLEAGFRAGSVLAVAVRARVRAGAEPAQARAELAGLLARLTAGAPHAARAVAAASLVTGPGEVSADLAFPREAVEELAAGVAARLERR